MKESAVRKKSFEFAIDIVNMYKKMAMEKREFVMSKQLLKAGTSIGANVREASNGESTADFIHKLAIAQKEADETLYWLELLNETHFINREEFSSLSHSCEELLKIIKSIILTTKHKSKKT
ncbi:hypothetical protein C5S31_00710 [ANME-1 cluster archaeon GoMg2]|nr:hypothetical protein [ANME-1 cluster archaeon GoMg2]